MGVIGVQSCGDGQCIAVQFHVVAASFQVTLILYIRTVSQAYLHS